jgi:hypothetical protein
MFLILLLKIGVKMGIFKNLFKEEEEKKLPPLESSTLRKLESLEKKEFSLNHINDFSEIFRAYIKSKYNVQHSHTLEEVIKELNLRKIKDSKKNRILHVVHKINDIKFKFGKFDKEVFGLMIYNFERILTGKAPKVKRSEKKVKIEKKVNKKPVIRVKIKKPVKKKIVIEKKKVKKLLEKKKLKKVKKNVMNEKKKGKRIGKKNQKTKRVNMKLVGRGGVRWEDFEKKKRFKSKKVKKRGFFSKIFGSD